MTRCFAKILLPTPFHHDSEIAKSVRNFASHTKAVCVHWPRDLRTNKENSGRAPEALLEYQSSQERALALRENQARPGEWGFYVAVDKRQADDKRRKARTRERNPLADCEVREPLPDYAMAADCSDWGADYWEGKYFEQQGFDGQMMDYDVPFALPENVQLHEGVHVPQLQSQPQPQAFQPTFQGRDFGFQEPRAEPRPEPRRSPIIVVDSAGQPQEMWSFAATHGPPGFGEWSSTVAPRFGPPAEFNDDEEAYLLDTRNQAQRLTLQCLEEDEALPPLPEPQPMPLPTPTRFGFVHFTQHLDQPVERRRSRSQPPVSTAQLDYTPLPVPASCKAASSSEKSAFAEKEPETPPRQGPSAAGEHAAGETPLPMSAKKRRGGRGRAGKPKPE